MKALRIRIVGGSLGGLFAGILLQRAGHDVKIYERSASGLGGRGAGLVSQQDLLRILRLIGSEHVAGIGVVARERIYFDRNGQVAETVHTSQTQISWDLLYNTVASRFTPESYLLDRQVTEVIDGDEGVELVFADGSRENAHLVIGADGLGSVVRANVNPVDHANKFAGYVTWRGLISETDLPAGASLLLDRFAFYVTKGIHVLGYLVPGPNGEVAAGYRRYNWVWYRPVADEDLRRTFTDRSGKTSRFSLPRGGLSPKRLSALCNDAEQMLPPQFALAVAAEPAPSIQGIFDYEAPRMIGKSIALVGDAAFVVRPHTAMGVSKAAGDAMALSNYLASERDVGSALQRYEQSRIVTGRYIADYGRRLGASAL